MQTSRVFTAQQATTYRSYHAQHGHVLPRVLKVSSAVIQTQEEEEEEEGRIASFGSQ